MDFSKLKTELQLQHSWIYIQRTPYPPERDLHIGVYCCTIHQNKETEAAEMSINRQTDNMLNIHNGVLPSLKGKMNFTGKWVDLEIIILSEVTQTKKDKCHMFSGI